MSCLCIGLASPVEGENIVYSVHTSLKLDLPHHLIISSASIKLNETIGQGKTYKLGRTTIDDIIVIGEYGIVYKGYIIKDGESFDEYLAIKTLKGTF